MLRAGVDAFAHGVRDQDIDEEFIALIRERPNIILVPNLPEPGVPVDLEWLEGSLPVTRLDALRAENTEQADAQAAYGIQARNLDRLNEAGVQIAMGTDGNTPWAAHFEMEDMVLAGMTPTTVDPAIVAAAVVAARPNEYALAEVQRPEPGHNEVLCRVRAVTICGTDAHEFESGPHMFPGGGFVPGHEFAGHVERDDQPRQPVAALRARLSGRGQRTMVTGKSAIRPESKAVLDEGIARRLVEPVTLTYRDRDFIVDPAACEMVRRLLQEQMCWRRTSAEAICFESARSPPAHPEQRTMPDPSAALENGRFYGRRRLHLALTLLSFLFLFFRIIVIMFFLLSSTAIITTSWW